MIVKFEPVNSDQEIVYCIVDYIWQYNSGWTRELIKNQGDYNITNITSKGYTVYQGLNEDLLLKEASKKYKFAVVISTGTEFINGNDFFNKIKKECKSDFLIKGHILDRGNAYYELHRQCYLVNLEAYCKLGKPTVGQQSLGESHWQTDIISLEGNIHDDYTPCKISQSTKKKAFMHKMHGWNIISKTLPYYNISAFDNDIRKSKKHFYPENQKIFLEKSDWIYKREKICANNFVHKKCTEWTNVELSELEQVVSPASGNWWIDYVSEDSKIVIYDYNKESINYWQKINPEYTYVLGDLLCDVLDLSILDPSKKTLINLSNIYAYEGTSFTYSLEKRLQKETEMIEYLRQVLPNAIISFSARACSGFIDCDHYGTAKYMKTYRVGDLICPTWHANGDWSQ